MSKNTEVGCGRYERELAEVQKYIAANMDQTLNRQVLAEVAGFSISHFHRLFTTRHDENVSDFVRRKRMERAGRKLRMGAVNITQVAHAAGYDTHSSFGKAFKQHFGVTPSQFRDLGCQNATILLKRGKE